MLLYAILVLLISGEIKKAECKFECKNKNQYIFQKVDPTKVVIKDRTFKVGSDPPCAAPFRVIWVLQALAYDYNRMQVSRSGTCTNGIGLCPQDSKTFSCSVSKTIPYIEHITIAIMRVTRDRYSFCYEDDTGCMECTGSWSAEWQRGVLKYNAPRTQSFLSNLTTH